MVQIAARLTQTHQFDTDSRRRSNSGSDGIFSRDRLHFTDFAGFEGFVAASVGYYIKHNRSERQREADRWFGLSLLRTCSAGAGHAIRKTEVTLNAKHLWGY